LFCIMPKRFRACFNWLKEAEMTAGKVTLVTVLSGTILATTTFIAYLEVLVPYAQADNVNTSVTVLNTPPTFTVGAHEETESSTSTPTNVNARLAFSATANDSSGDDYFLIVCKTSTTATPNSGAPPTCNGGVSNQWAISGTTTSDAEAIAATTTRETVYWETESNNWYAFVCDVAAVGPRCSAYSNSDPGFPNNSSPFVINHPPVFTAVSNDSPKDPGQFVTWTVTATDTDRLRGYDQLTFFACKSNGAGAFSTSTGSGCNGGAWATSTQTTLGNTIATSTEITIPWQDNTYNAYIYVVDDHNLAATSTLQGTASNFTVSNVAPSISASTISVLGATTSNIQLVNPLATSGPLTVTFTVTDNNSCKNAANGDEISSATTSIYRSGAGAGQNSCQSSSSFNQNSCYPSIDPSTPTITCTQTGSCTQGGTYSYNSFPGTVEWTCTFSMWSTADATVANSTYSAEQWRSSAQTLDDDSAISSIEECTTGCTEVEQFLAFDIPESSIGFSSLEPGQQMDPLDAATSTALEAHGNVGLDEYLYGDTMCPNWLNQPDYCDHAWGDTGIATSTATSTITAWNQKFATSAVTYAQATMLHSSSSPKYFALQVPKSTSTTTPDSRDTLWAIKVPSTITRAGSYSGVNTIYAAVSNFNYW
jgi:hypothetical protein